jgi:hypothetical protein
MDKSAILLVVVLLLLSACTRDEEPVTVSSSGPSTNGSLAKAAGGRSSLDLIEDDYDAGLLDKNSASLYREYAVSAAERLPGKYRSAEIGKDATYSMLQIAREWDKLSSSARKEILEIRANGFGVLKETLITDHFVLHYTTQSNFGVPAQDNDLNGIPDFIDIAAQSWEAVWSREVDQLGYPSPKYTPGTRFHVYYKDMPYYGYTVPESIELLSLSPVPYGTAAAWIAVENDFYGFPRNDEDMTGMETIRSGALKVTQAHEFMHALQFNINVYQSGWLMESTATWAEDAVYDNVNDWHWYIPYFLATPDYPIFNRYPYGSAFFMNYLSERYGEDIPRFIWEAAKVKTTPDALRDIALGGNWEKMKDFAPAEYSLDISDYTTNATTVVPAPKNLIRAVHVTYPVSVQVPASTNKIANRAPWGLGANFVEFLPAGGSTLTITFDGADGYAWRAMVVGTPKNGNPSPTIWEIALDATSSGTFSVPGFGVRWSKIALVPAIVDRPGTAVPYAYTAELH